MPRARARAPAPHLRVVGEDGPTEEPRRTKAPHGNHYVRKRGARYEVTFYVDGQRRYYTDRTRRLCLDYADEQIRLAGQDVDEAGATMTVAELCERFLAYCYDRCQPSHPGERPAMSITSMPNYRNLAGWVTAGLGRYKIRELRAGHIDDFVHRVTTKGIDYPYADGRPCPRRQLRPKSARNLVAFLSRMLNQARKWRLLYGENEASLAEKPRVTRKPKRVWSPERWVQVLREIEGERLEALFWVMLTCALRKGELVALKWDDVDFDRGLLRVDEKRFRLAKKEREIVGVGIHTSLPKTEAGVRTLPLVPEAAEKLRAWRERQELERRAAKDHWEERGAVFTSRHGNFLDVNRVNDHVDKVLKKHGWEGERLTIHEFRHTAIKTLLHNTANLMRVKEFAGHSSVRVTTDVYGDEIRDGHRETAELITSVLRRAARPAPRTDDQAR
jgi:integrase